MKFQSPWMGRVKGSAGNMTGCKVYDKNVMRAKAFEVNNPNTGAQQVQRAYFAELTKLVAGFTPDQLRTLFPNKPKAMSRRNALAKQLAEYNMWDRNAKIVDFAEIDTLGNASTMDFGTTTAIAANSSVSVTLDNAVKANTELANNYFIAALVNSTKGLVSLDTTSAKVSVGTIAPALPAGWDDTDTIHAIPLVLNTTTSFVGFGTLSVMKRPSQKTA